MHGTEGGTSFLKVGGYLLFSRKKDLMWVGGQGDLLAGSQENFFLVASVFFCELLDEAISCEEGSLIELSSALQGCPQGEKSNFYNPVGPPTRCSGPQSQGRGQSPWWLYCALRPGSLLPQTEEAETVNSSKLSLPPPPSPPFLA